MLEQLTGLLEPLAWLRFDLLGRLFLAGVLGGLIGWEREYSGKPAGLRTNVLICVGAALLSDISVHFASFSLAAGYTQADPGRIAAQIVSGIGFLGAGTIIQSRGSVSGLTTAATLWVVAAIGIAVGGGAYVAAVGTTALVLVALVPLSWVEDWVSRRHTVRTVRVVAEERDGVVEDVVAHLRERSVEAAAARVERGREGSRLVIFLTVEGTRDAVEKAGRTLIHGKGIVGVTLDVSG